MVVPLQQQHGGRGQRQQRSNHSQPAAGAQLPPPGSGFGRAAGIARASTLWRGRGRRGRRLAVVVTHGARLSRTLSHGGERDVVCVSSRANEGRRRPVNRIIA